MTTELLPLPSLIRASARDAATISMMKAGRSKMTDADWNAMCETQDRLIGSLYGEGPEGFFKFSLAEQAERMGLLRLNMKPAAFKKTFANIWAAAQQANSAVATV